MQPAKMKESGEEDEKEEGEMVGRRERVKSSEGRWVVLVLALALAMFRKNKREEDEEDSVGVWGLKYSNKHTH